MPQVVERTIEVPKIPTLHGTAEQILDVPVPEIGATVGQVAEHRRRTSSAGCGRTGRSLQGSLRTGFNDVSKDRSSKPLLFHSQRRSLRCLSLRRVSLMPKTVRSPRKIWSWRARGQSRSSSTRPLTSMNRKVHETLQFPSCNILIRWSMSLLGWSRSHGEDS